MSCSPDGEYVLRYIVANHKHGTVYTCVTGDLVRRAYEHREGLIEGFDKDHGCKDRVWFETHEYISEAILREKRIKKWPREWKDRMIAEASPDRYDLWWACRTSGVKSAPSAPHPNYAPRAHLP